MADRHRPPAVGHHELGFAAVCLVAVALLVPVQFVSLVLFDATGLDAVTPDVAFAVLLPAGAVALAPAALAHRLYTRRWALVLTGGLLAAFALLAAGLPSYGACAGPGCRPP